MDEHLQTLEHAQQTAIDLSIQFGPTLLVALLILATGFYVGRWIARLTGSLLEKTGLENALRQLLERVVRILVPGLFFIMALQNPGVELLPLLAGLGVAGAGIALAMQGVLGNLAAGLTIIFTRPFQLGEYISIADEEGLVEGIHLFNTVPSHPDHSRIVIPNRKIVGEILHNFSTLRQLDVIIGVAYDTSSEIIQTVLETFRERGTHIPFPQREVRLSGQP